MMLPITVIYHQQNVNNNNDIYVINNNSNNIKINKDIIIAINSFIFVINYDGNYIF